ncbi:MAG: SpoIIIAH-like family protein [Clostridia bacterium]|nr:SpoIIIAH-like family protein [Clostridia bacterium]
MEKTARNRRFAILLAAALLLLGGAVWLNLKLGGDDATDILGGAPETTPDADSRETMVSVYGDYFNSFRRERSEVRAREIEYLRSIINSGSADEDTLEDAQGRLLELVSRMEKEFTIESQIRGKGFLDAAATFQGGTVTVVIDGETLSDEEVARILDIVMTETGLPAASVKISLGS